MAQQKLPQLLKDLGSKLENPPSTKDALVKLLKQAATCLSELDQSPTKSILESMKPFLNAIVKTELLKHQDREVKLLVATNVCEITRITAPEAPYSDDVLKDIFHLIVSTFSGLSDTSGPSFGRRVFILETLARYRSCVVMLDLECDDLVNQMFSTFLSVTSDDHPESVLNSMQTIMVVLLEESEDVRDELLLSLLSVLGRNKSDVAMAARKLAMNVIEHCSVKLEPGVRQFLISSMSGDSKSLNGQIDYHEIIYDVYRCAPQILSGVVPFLTGELLTDQLDIRLKAVRLVGDLFALPDSAMSQTFQPIFSEFLKRLTDRVVEVRMSVLERAKICLLSNPFRAEASQVISALCDRLLDYDENVRKQVVAVICDVACNALTSIPVESVKLVAERLRDKSLLVKKYTMERLAEIYRVFCLSQSNGSTKTDDFDWIPGKILRCFYDKDFRSDTIEPILCGSLFPIEFSVKQKVGNWVRLFSGFDKVEVKALEKILEQKQRLQQEMQRYLSLRQMHQENDAPEFQKKILFCFRIMSRCFTDPAKAEDYFQILDQLKDANIWKILIILLDPNTSSHQACSSQDDLLKILGEKHRLYDFLSSLSLKCSYVLFNKEHVKEILLEADLRKSAGNTQLTLACMNILVILACFSPLLLSGIEKDLVHFLKDDNEVIKEGVLHVLAKAGGTIREQLGVSSSSLDLILEKICLEGSRRQAKYAVHALAAITKDDGLMSLSVLYKRLVNMLEEKTHLPAVLQSLGCIAQTAMSVFETRESELERFIKTNILECSNIVEDNAKECWDDRSKLCSLKIFGIKTLVKSYLPVKDAHLRLGIDGLFEILKNILSFGEITEKIESSLVDKAHLRLAAAKAVLRLSKHWDHKIHVDLFYLTLRTLEISFPQAKKQFLNKVHQYIKERLLDPKYACAFLFDITGSQKPDFEEDKHNLSDIIQMCQQGKARQLALQSDANSSVVYPEYILPYLVYALSHHSSCPNVDECRDVKAFEPVYSYNSAFNITKCLLIKVDLFLLQDFDWIVLPLHLFLSMLMHGDDDVKSEVSINKGQESISIIVSIFHCIKCSEDAADPAKSKNSYAICDLGMSITKRLAQKEDDLQGLIVSVPLPPMLYKPREKKEGDDPLVSEGQTWLAEENVLTHFESLKLEVNGMIHPEVVDDGVLKDSETDGNDVPLGKIIKRLRAKGTKAKKMVKNESLPAGTEHEENVDILEMVREINLDNLGTSSKFESSNGHECTPKNLKIDQKHQKRKKLVAGETTNSPVPKRRRSSSAQGASKGLKRTSTDDLPQEEGSSSESPEIDEELHVGSEDKMSLQENVVEPAESDLLVSCFKKNSNSSSKHKSKNSNKDHNDEAHNIGEIDDYDVKDCIFLLQFLQKSNQLVETDSTTAITNSKFSSGSSKKRKRRSIAGLAKCTSKKGGSETMDLIDCRIKVWWPVDKRFYGGVVKSYDSEHKKYVVLYDDGDVEVLRLDKERWELVDNGRKPTKRLKSSKGPSKKGLSSEKKKKSLSFTSKQTINYNIFTI
ncbi:sister chromatid cohesion protein PDS5 homolog A-A isoform X1 [Camellia sinensis]|uniref:sister chromatid cohesion protein PDS5 homolog A-A isoform X1 n=1 Tax=Camellia sinensis TaxID=4442 RepID=UPI0010357455|nr:sister chromatid cohesion protein PDS5 homolog A-A isoform X1 [Camellia sinensis]